MAQPGKHQRFKLNARFIEAVKNSGMYPDGNGLYLRVEGVSKRWVQRLTINGKRHNLGLGGYPKVSLREARQKTLVNREDVRDGGDPLDTIAITREPTFSQAAEKVVEFHRPTWTSTHHIWQWQHTLEQFANPYIGHKLVGTITSADILQVLTPIWTIKHETARRLRQRIGTVMKWSIAHGYRTDNPAGEVLSMVLPRVPKLKAHHKALPYAQTSHAIQVIRTSPGQGVTRLSLEFLILTAARSGEVRFSRWDEVNLDVQTWTIPALRMKAKREHRIPLSNQAAGILTEARALDMGNGLVFPSPHSGQPLSDMTYRMLLRRQGIDAVPHGFRSTFRDWASELTNAPWAVMEAALAHAIPNATEAAYARSDLFDRRRVLMQQWADYLSDLHDAVTLLAPHTA